jgi:hypothetical protein
VGREGANPHSRVSENERRGASPRAEHATQRQQATDQTRTVAACCAAVAASAASSVCSWACVEQARKHARERASKRDVASAGTPVGGSGGRWGTRRKNNSGGAHARGSRCARSGRWRPPRCGSPGWSAVARESGSESARRKAQSSRHDTSERERVRRSPNSVVL